MRQTANGFVIFIVVDGLGKGLPKQGQKLAHGRELYNWWEVIQKYLPGGNLAAIS